MRNLYRMYFRVRTQYRFSKKRWLLLDLSGSFLGNVQNTPTTPHSAQEQAPITVSRLCYGCFIYIANVVSYFFRPLFPQCFSYATFLRRESSGAILFVGVGRLFWSDGEVWGLVFLFKGIIGTCGSVRKNSELGACWPFACAAFPRDTLASGGK